MESSDWISLKYMKSYVKKSLVIKYRDEKSSLSFRRALDCCPFNLAQRVVLS